MLSKTIFFESLFWTDVMRDGVSYRIWQIHKSITGVVGTHGGALQPGKVDSFALSILAH
jgi:hypothetical protein